MGRICSLHDSILSTILSHLPINAAIRTKVLSKQWQNLWFPTQELVFCQSSDHNAKLYLEGIADYIHKVLPLDRFSRSSKVITKYEIRLNHGSFIELSINLAIEAAILRRVKEIVLIEEKTGDWRYIVPQYLCSYDLLERLTLHNCYFCSSLMINWTSLKALTLGFSKLDNVAVNNILEGCPKLENLELKQCHAYDQIVSSSNSSLRKLVIIQCRNNACVEPTVVVSVPTVKCLILKVRKRIQLINVLSLVDVIIDFYPHDSDTKTKVKEEFAKKIDGNALTELLDKVGHVERVRLGIRCVQVASWYMMRGLLFRSSLPKCKFLVLETPMCRRWDIPGILCLIRNSPSLEKLVLNLTTETNNYEFLKNTKIGEFNNAKTYWETQKKLSYRFPRHLTNVKIVGLCTQVVGFAQYILENAKFLEKMELTKSNGKDELLIIRNILRLPRSCRTQISIS